MANGTRRAPTHRSAPRRAWQPTWRPPARHASRTEGLLRFASLTSLALVPGVGLLAAGRRFLGGLLLLPIIIVGAVGVAALVDDAVRMTLLDVAVRPSALLAVAVCIVIAGLAWCASVALTGWTTRPTHSTGPQRAAVVTFVGLLVVVAAVPAAAATHLVLAQRDVVQTVFAAGDENTARPGVAAPGALRKDPWKDTPRVNVLLLGSDAGRDRTGVRPDSMIVASVDTKTGRTVLLGLPRSLQKVPFPQTNPLHEVWPNGFDCGDECLLNAVWTQAEQYRDRFGADPNPGLTTTRDVIGEVLGLRIDYYMTLDLEGFAGFVDAMGGVTVDVPRRIPIGGGKSANTGAPLPITGYIEPGRQKLNGYRALWFARSREGSNDYDRMKRQRCMVGALLDQSNPVALLARYSRLAGVLKDNLQTDVPREDLTAWVTLVQRIQQGGISSLPFTNEVINTVNPDFDQIHRLVQSALFPKPASRPTATSTWSGSGTTTTTPTPPSTSAPTATTSQTADSIGSTC